MPLVLHSMQPAMEAWGAVAAQRKAFLDQRQRQGETERGYTETWRDVHTHRELQEGLCVGVGTAGRGIGLAVGSRCPWAADHLALQPGLRMWASLPRVLAPLKGISWPCGGPRCTF